MICSFTFVYGMRRNFIPRNWRLVPCFEARGGSGNISPTGPDGDFIDEITGFLPGKSPRRTGSIYCLSDNPRKVARIYFYRFVYQLACLWGSFLGH